MAFQTYQVRADPAIHAVRILSIQRDGNCFILSTELNDKIKIRQPIRKDAPFGNIKPGDYFIMTYDPRILFSWNSMTPEEFESEFVDYQDLYGV